MVRRKSLKYAPQLPTAFATSILSKALPEKTWLFQPISRGEKVESAKKTKIPKKPWIISQESRMSLLRRIRETDTAWFDDFFVA